MQNETENGVYCRENQQSVLKSRTVNHQSKIDSNFQDSSDFGRSHRTFYGQRLSGEQCNS